MLSERVPHAPAANAWARRLAERRVARADLLDLTESNPTRVGLGGEETALQALADPRGARYEPDPRGAASARAAIAALYSARGLAIRPEHIVLTASTSESYAHLFRMLANPGDVVLIPAPSYPLFEPLAALESVRLEPYRLRWDGRWHLDRGDLERAVAHAGERLRAAIVVQPNNPTGSCLDADEIAALEDLCARRDAALISDEVFGDFPRPPAGAPLPSLLEGRRVVTFALEGLSKSCGLPQLKLGWIAATGPEIDPALEALEWIADLFLSVSTPVQLALPRLLEGRAAFQARVRGRLAANLERLESCAARRPEMEALPAEGGWNAVLRLPSRLSGETWALELLEKDVVVHPGEFYDFEGGAWLVVSLLVEPRVFSTALDRLEVVLGESR